MDSIERIQQMEFRFNQTIKAVQEMVSALENYEDVQENIKLLDDYLGSDDWKKDLAADEAGYLPDELRRGVLSEDGIWNLLTDWHEMNRQIIKLIEKYKSTTKI